jgi:hypothetical protein
MTTMASTQVRQFHEAFGHRETGHAGGHEAREENTDA